MLASFLIWGDSLTHPVLSSCLSGEFLWNIPCWLHFYLASFSDTSHAGFLFLSEEFLLNILCRLHFYLANFSYTSHATFSFLWGVSLTHPMLASILICGVSLTDPLQALLFCGEFLLHIPCWLFFLFLNLGFLLRTPCCLHFYLGSLS